MVNNKTPILASSHDTTIIWSYAIVAIFAVLAMYGLSTHTAGGDAPEILASMLGPQP